MITFLMQTAATCTYGGIDTNGWININIIVIIASLSIAGFFYAISNFFPTRTREKARGVVRFEFFQGMISTFIIVILVGTAMTSCEITSAIVTPIAVTQNYAYNGNLFQYDQYYVGNLLFNTGVKLVTTIYSASIGLFIASSVVDAIASGASYTTYLKLPLVETDVVNASLVFSPSISGVYDSYTFALTDMMTPMVILTFSALFVIYLMLPFIEAIALTVVLPVALIMRSFGWAGPKLREAANSFLALAIGFYFVFPIMLMLNPYIVGWTNCINNVQPCNPYVGYMHYSLNQLKPSSLFTSESTNINVGPLDFKLPLTFYSAIFSEYVNPFNAPGAVTAIATAVGEYMYEGIFLVALAIGVTVAFSVGLAKGLNAGMNFVAGGSFWG